MSDKISDKMSDKQNQAIKTGDKQTIRKQLAKCPFCGGKAVLVGDKYHWVFCKGCQGGSHAFETKEEAITAWNTRKPMERILERLEERIDSKEDERERARIDNPLRYEMCDSYIGAMNYAIEIIEEELKP